MEGAMARSLYLAYDGSISGDWVARYALRMAGTVPDRRLLLVHIQDGSMNAERLEAKLQHIASEGRALDVELSVQIQRLTQNVLTSLLEVIPAGDDVYCICGARATSRGKGFLAGTVSQRLLRARKFNTLALRVVDPGLLGRPGNIMFPLGGHPRGFQAAMPFLQLLAPSIHTLTLLRIMTVNSLLFRYLTIARARDFLHKGNLYLRQVMEEIMAATGSPSFRFDDHVVLSDDWPKEILIQAARLHARLILLGASDRFLQSRFYYGNRLEQILRESPCDVGIYRKI